MKSLLRKLQIDFASAIRFKDQTAIEALPINETNGISKQTRLEVYAYGYWIRLEKSLREDFYYVFEKLGAEATQTIQQFIIEAKPGDHILGDVSLAFCDFIIKTKPEYKKEAILDHAILISEFTPWIFEFERIKPSLLEPQDLGNYETDDVATHWNTTLQFVENRIIVQKDDMTEIFTPETQTFQLLLKRHDIQTLTALLEQIAELNLSDSEASAAIAFLTANEVLYFAKR